MPTYPSYAKDHHHSHERLFGRERPLHAIFGGGKGDLLLFT